MISASMVKELRNCTGDGLNNCIKDLEEEDRDNA